MMLIFFLTFRSTLSITSRELEAYFSDALVDMGRYYYYSSFCCCCTHFESELYFTENSYGFGSYLYRVVCVISF